MSLVHSLYRLATSISCLVLASDQIYLLHCDEKNWSTKAMIFSTCPHLVARHEITWMLSYLRRSFRFELTRAVASGLIDCCVFIRDMKEVEVSA